MSGQAKVTITGDASSAVGAANKLGDSLRQAGHHGGSIGDKIAMANHHLERTAARALSAVAAIKMMGAAFEEANKRAEKTASANKQEGRGALGRSIAFQKLGLNQETAEAFSTSIGGAATQDELNGSIEALGKHQESARYKVSPGQSMKFIAAAASGAFSQEELLKGLERGQVPDSSAIQARIDSLSPEARRELRNRGIERTNDMRAQGALASNGEENRLAESDMAARKAERPIASSVEGVVKSVPGLGGEMASIIDAGQRAIIKEQRRTAESNEDLANRARISLNTPGKTE